MRDGILEDEGRRLVGMTQITRVETVNSFHRKINSFNFDTEQNS